MTGSPAERHLLGSLIFDSRQYRNVEDIVNPDDFEDERLGRVYAGIGQMVSMGKPVDQITVQNMWPEWEIRGIPSTDVFLWADAEVYVHASHEYARAVKDASVRRGIRNVIQFMADNARDESFPPLDVASRAAALLDEIRQGASSGLLNARTLAEILEGTDTYDWIIPGLLERQDRLVITGAEGAGKTTWVRQLAVLAAAGIHPTKFTPMAPLKVLVIDAENTERQWRRAVRWTSTEAARIGAVDPRLNVHIQAGRRIDITRGSHLSEIHRLLDIHTPDVLFIGPLYKLVPKAITNDDDAAPLIVALDSLRERGVALVMEAHAGKAAGMDGERNLAPRGSAALMGWPEFGLGIRHTDDPQVVSVVRWRGDRDEREWPKAMHKGGEWPWMPTTEW